MTKKEERSPYHPFTVDEVMAAELGNYYIQVGPEIFSSENGKMAFSKDRADHYFQQIWDGLNDMKKSGDQESADDASTCLLHLKIYPLRIH